VVFGSDHTTINDAKKKKETVRSHKTKYLILIHPVCVCVCVCFWGEGMSVFLGEGMSVCMCMCLWGKEYECVCVSFSRGEGMSVRSFKF